MTDTTSDLASDARCSCGHFMNDHDEDGCLGFEPVMTVFDESEFGNGPPLSNLCMCAIANQDRLRRRLAQLLPKLDAPL